MIITDINTKLIVFNIDPKNRTISIPSDGAVFGVVGDIEINQVMFKIPKYCAGFDITGFVARVNHVNSNGDANYYETAISTLDDDTVCFIWLMEPDVTAYVGNVTLSVKLYKKDNGKIVKEFNTRSAIGKVLDGFDIENTVTPEQQQTLLEKLELEFKNDINSYIAENKERLINDIRVNVVERILPSGSASHNAIYRGKYLGNVITQEQAEAISNGTFDDLFVGDYWTMNGINHRIGDFNYWINSGFPESEKIKIPHLLIVPDTCYSTGVMNSSNSTTGGYASSTMKSQILNNIANTLPDEIKSRLLTHRTFIDGTWVSTSVDLMNEVMIYGCYVLTDNTNKQTSDNRQLSLFRLSSEFKNINENYWLRNYANSTEYTMVSYYGDSSKDKATRTYGIRPVFAIHSGLK